MAFLRTAKTEEEIKKMPVSSVRKAYSELAVDYNHVVEGDYAYCHECNTFLSRTAFYTSSNYASGLFPICKKCLLKRVEQPDKKTGKSNESKETVKKVLQFMDLPYIDSLYESCCESVANEVNERNKQSPFVAYLVPIKSLPQYKSKTWVDSEFGYANASDEEDTKVNSKTIKSGKKRFGSGYTDEDYMFLENEYKDWTTRYECNTKAQEAIFERLSFKKLEINKASKQGQPTKDLDKTYQELLATANIQPRQTSMDTLSEAQTFGTLIQKYEETRPLPEIDPELEDVDKIGLYIDVFFKGHASKMLGLKNNFSHIYEKFMKKFTVSKPEYSEEEDSEDIFNRIFGSSGDTE